MNRKVFYPRLAFSNLRKNSSVYIPYLLTCVCSVAMFYIMCSISLNPGLAEMNGATGVIFVLQMGNIVIGLFSIIFLFYTNSFLAKRRKKEVGLYQVLGMEKRHIARMLFFEGLISAAVSLGLGLLTGILLSRLMFLTLLKMLNFDISLEFTLSGEALTASLILFGAIFLLSLLYNLKQIHGASPVELLRGGQQGEKEPRAKWLLALVGAILLGAGYGIAIWCTSPLEALLWFFAAVVLVILGTYLLFTSGSIAILKLLKRNKKFYYTPAHFTTISGMMYRMKQNAVGLANICILSTMVLVILSTTVSLYVGNEESLETRYPQDLTMRIYETEEDKVDEVLLGIAEKKAEKFGVALEGVNSWYDVSLTAVKDGTRFLTQESQMTGLIVACEFILLPYSQYAKVGKAERPGPGEALIFSAKGDYGEAVLSVGGLEFRVKEELQSLGPLKKSDGNVVDSYYMVLPDWDAVEQVYQAALPGEEMEIEFRLGFDINGGQEQETAFLHEMRQEMSNISTAYSFQSKQLSRGDFLALNGGFLFLGLFLGGLFLMATALIIYYKQISEGYDDKERFEIMQKVGMSKREVKRTIRTQILMVFFLPLVMAVIHIAFAFQMYTKILAFFSLGNLALFAVCTLGTILVFALAYGVVYLLTARTYYRIVN